MYKKETDSQRELSVKKATNMKDDNMCTDDTWGIQGASLVVTDW